MFTLLQAFIFVCLFACLLVVVDCLVSFCFVFVVVVVVCFFFFDKFYFFDTASRIS